MKPKSLYLDTGCFIARELSRDQFHGAAVKGWTSLLEIDCPLYCCEHVFDETMTLLARRHSYAFAAECGQRYLDSRLIEWVSATKEDLKLALVLMRKYADQAASFTDCVSFVLMKREGIKHVFGFDRHFSSAGFKVWAD